MIRKPNAIQKLLHRFFMLRSVTAFFAPRVHRIDIAILKWTGGKFAGAGLLGWPIIQLTTIGAKTNRPHTMPLVAVFDGEKIAVIASSLGRDHNPGWYYNLKAHPECDVQFRGQSQMYVAREVIGQEYERYWQLGLALYAGYEKYRQRTARGHIPIMLLEPKS